MFVKPFVESGAKCPFTGEKNMNVLANAAKESLKAGSSMQQEIKNILEDVLCPESMKRETICEAMSEFKTWAEDEFVSVADDKQKARKQVNNVINDVSRTCRESGSGFSIHLKSRKGGYIYEAREPVPRASSIPPAMGYPTAKSEDSDFCAEDITEEILSDYIAANPVTVMAEIFKQYDRERLGEIMVMAKKVIDAP
jgi:hypothetical protein